MALGKCSLMQYDLSVLIHHVSVRSFFGLKDWNLLVFLSYAKPRKEARFVKNWLLLNVWNSSKLLGLILLTSIKRLYIMACLTIFTWKNVCALLNSVQKFIEIQGWLLLTFFICLQNWTTGGVLWKKVFLKI